jgi:lipoprotein-releasing system permease protein
MYKLLLSLRYLRTRFIALASIVSVTLGVATLIVVNSVMSGFASEMKDRLHGILADVELASPGLGEIPWPEEHLREIRDEVGDELESMTCLVRVPALITFEFRGRQWTQQVMLLGVDEQTFGAVCEFQPFLLDSVRREKLDFMLHDGSYDQRLGDCGWSYRRQKESSRRQVEAIMELERRNSEAGAAVPEDPASVSNAPREVVFLPLPDEVPSVEAAAGPELASQSPGPISGFDPASQYRPQVRPEDLFNPVRDQHTGIILGVAIANRMLKDPDTGEQSELFLLRPGDDVSITLPTAGDSPQPVIDNCTVVDFYSSNMHEYDSTFAFMPLERLQKIRGMIDPVTGSASVSSIHMRFRPGANLEQLRDRISARFPPEMFPYVIQTWQDTQRPLLSAVEVELTILNILLFLIIAVAGFGILATFFMIVVEKTRDIGILKALGAPSSGVMSIFLGYGVCLGMVGTGVGIGLGLLFVHFINEIADGIQWLTGREVFDPTMYFFSEIPTLISPWMVVWVAVGAVLIAVVASVLPALRAARLRPVEALRYE